MNLDKLVTGCRNKRDIERRITEAGWRYLDSGYYSSVYYHKDEPRRVLKVGHTMSDGYLAYAYYCAAHYGEDYLPRIFGVVECGDAYVVEMEKYESIKCGDGYTNTAKTHEMQVQWTMLCCFLPRKSSRDIEFTTDPLDPRAMETMGRVMRSMISFFGHFVEWDFHSANCMWDARRGQVVVTDPLHEMKRSDIEHAIHTQRSRAASKLASRRNMEPQVQAFDPRKLPPVNPAHLPVGKSAHHVWDDRLMMHVPVRRGGRAKGSMSFHLDKRMEQIRRDMAKIQPGVHQGMIQGMAGKDMRVNLLDDLAFNLPAIKAQPATYPKLVNPKPGMPKRFDIFDRLAQAALAKDMRFL
ncbi:protein kinase [Psuedomonas phage SVOphi44]